MLFDFEGKYKQAKRSYFQKWKDNSSILKKKQAIV
jgi:hypothetical protein